MDNIEPYPYKLNLLDKYPKGDDPKNPVRIYTDGVFDCFHYGHARLFQKVKTILPNVHLIVGVCSDEDVTSEKARPIMNATERIESVKHCKWVDSVVTAPWIPTLEYMDSINAHYIAHDPEPYPYKGIEDVYFTIKDAGRFIATTRTSGISTTDVILKIIEDFDVYVERSIKKKVPINDLHLPASKWIKYQGQAYGSRVLNKLLEISEDIYKEDNSKTLIKEFIDSQKKNKN